MFHHGQRCFQAPTYESRQAGMRKPVFKILMALLLVTALSFNLACTADQVTNSLDNITSAVEIALPFVAPAAGIPAPLVTLISDYLSTVTTAADQSIDILASTEGTPQSRAAQVIDVFTKAISESALIRNLPAGQRNTLLVQAALAVANAVERFLSHMKTTQATLALSSPYANSFLGSANGQKAVKVHVDRLKKIQHRLKSLEAKLAR